MSMLIVMDKLNYLMISCCVMFVCIYGTREDLLALCEVGLMVHRGTTWTTAPQQSLTVSCPVKHCGEPLNVTWCRFFDTENCEQMNTTENVEIRQSHDVVRDQLISYLSFKQISIDDDGLYRCSVEGYKDDIISHSINISVSDKYQGVVYSVSNEVVSPSSAGDEASPWLPYFIICVAICLLIFTLTVVTLLSSYGCNRLLTYWQPHREEISTHMIPDLPSWRPSSSPVLQTHVSVLNEIYTPSTTPASPPPLEPAGNRPAAGNTPDNKNQASGGSVYAVIKHKQSGIPASKE